MSVFVKSELPALLRNPNIGEIDGVPRSALLEIYDTQGLDAAKRAINFNSAQQVHFSQLSISNLDTWLTGDKAKLEAAFANKALQNEWINRCSGPIT